MRQARETSKGRLVRSESGWRVEIVCGACARTVALPPFERACTHCDAEVELTLPSANADR